VSALLAVYAETSHGKLGRRRCLVVYSAIDLSTSDPEMAKRGTGVLAGHKSARLTLSGKARRMVLFRVRLTFTPPARQSSRN
jgi:hypothetical protein